MTPLFKSRPAEYPHCGTKIVQRLKSVNQLGLNAENAHVSE